MRFVRFKDVYGKETYVNADRVNYIRDHGGGSTEIHFGTEEATVWVEMETTAVASALLNARESLNWTQLERKPEA